MSKPTQLTLAPLKEKPEKKIEEDWTKEPTEILPEKQLFKPDENHK